MKNHSAFSLSQCLFAILKLQPCCLAIRRYSIKRHAISALLNDCNEPTRGKTLSRVRACALDIMRWFVLCFVESAQISVRVCLAVAT
jgi:hypothetical protein